MAFFQPARDTYINNPYPSLHRLRDDEPVFRSAELGGWVLTRHDDVLRVLSDDDHFSSDPRHATGPMGEQVRAIRANAPMGEVPILGNSDAPNHTRLRTVVNRAFTPRAVADFRPTVEELLGELLEGVDSDGAFDVMSGVAQPLAVLGVLAFLGVAPADSGQVREWSGAIMAARSGETAAASAAMAARAEFETHLRGSPRAGVIATLLEAEGNRLTIDELIMLLIHISFAGNGPTAFAIGNALAALAEYPGEFGRLRRGEVPVGTAVEECLRFDSPTHVVNRFATRNVAIGGKTIREGESVFAVIAAANRDPAAFEDPDCLDVGRTPNRHLSFGQGIHYCLGAPLARLELAVVLEAFAAGFDQLSIAEGRLEWASTFLLRGPRMLVLQGAVS